MAIVSCTECSKKISSLAPVCSHCGHQTGEVSDEDLEILDRALDKLGTDREHSRKCTLVELRYFVGLTLQQAAEALGVSMATVKRDWEFTKAWLLKEMRGNQRHA